MEGVIQTKSLLSLPSNPQTRIFLNKFLQQSFRQRINVSSNPLTPKSPNGISLNLHGSRKYQGLFGVQKPRFPHACTAAGELEVRQHSKLTTIPLYKSRHYTVVRSAKLPDLPPRSPPPPFYWGETPEEEFYKSQNVRNNKFYFQTPNGKLFTQSWLPLDETQPIKAVVFMTHGYRGDTSWSFQKICIEYANWGYAVFAADMLGHGRSDGIRAYVGDMDKVAATSLSYFLSVRRSETYRKLPAFLFGESMGGLVTMLMYLQSEPDTWTGLILSAPLFVTPEKMTPSKLHITMYGLLFGLADTWPVMVMPDKKVPVNAIRDPEKLKLIAMNPLRYFGKHRVGTMREVVKMTNYIQNNFHKVKVPFITLHGTSDEVTCPSGSQMLYDKASSEDKALKLYEGMYHSLIQGEPDEAANLVLADIRKWIDEKTIQYGPKNIDE